MEKRTILIAGAGSTIAQSTISALHREHMNTILLSRGSDDGITTIEDYGGDLPMDLPSSLDGLVYFPGTVRLAPFHRITLEQFREDWEINVGGFINVLQRVLPALERGTNPSVVGLTSVAVQTGLGFHASIAQAKGGLETLLRALAAEYAPRGIRFNAVAPSLVESKMTENLVNSEDKRDRMNKRHPLGRFGQPQDIAEAVTFLLGPRSTWITGQVLGVDGGYGATRQ